MKEHWLPKKLRLELANNASDLLIQIYDEPFSKELTETEKEFEDLIISLSRISEPYKYLADSYVHLYQYVKEKKKKEGINGRNNRI